MPAPPYLPVANRSSVADTRPRLPAFIAAQNWLTPDGSNTVKTFGRGVDGRLAFVDADRRRRRPRGLARDQRVPVDGAAFADRLRHALPADPGQWRLCRDED